MTLRVGFKYILKRLKEFLVKTSDTKLVPEEQLNKNGTCRGADMKESAAELNKLRTDYSSKSTHYLPSEECKKIKFLKCTSATFLVTLLIVIAFVVLPMIYLLHCFNFLNSQWPPNKFNPLMVDDSHSNRRKETFLHQNSNMPELISSYFVTHDIPKNYVNHTKDVMFPRNISTIDIFSQCSNIVDAFKFDCYPENGATESACTQRGCCWSSKLVNHTSFKKNSLDVPYCYYPSNYGGYKFINVSETLYGSTAFLQRSFSSPYPNDAQILKMDIMYETEQRLHIKIYDPIHRRFEPPYPEVPVVERSASKRNYEIVLDTIRTGFKVLRKSNCEIIFNAQDVGGFIFADQFLQLSALLPSNNVYGLGEHRSTLQLSTKWQRFTMFNSDQWPIENVNLYGSHPFYLVMENSGKSHGVFLLNSNALEVLLQPAPAITFRAIGGILDVYFFMGPSPEGVVQQYTDVVGKPFMPPYWGLGFHLCRFGYKTLNHTRDVWKRTLKAGIPLDVQWNDLDYMERSNDFTYDKVNFQGLPEFVKELHKLGMHYIPIIDPGISASEVPNTYPPYDDGLKMGVFVMNSSGQPFVGKVWNAVSTVWPDFTHPHTVDYWMKQLKMMHNEFQFDGAWIDMNEPSNFLSGSIHGCPNTSLDYPPYVPNVSGGQLFYHTLCMSSSQYAGKHYDLHNLYGFTEAIITTFSLAEIRGKRPFVISRSTFPGHGHYAGHWTGDIHSTWYDMSKSISEVLSFNMFGIPLVGADICGFNGNTTAALCQRWMQLGAFYPFSRNHNSDDTIPQDPVILGPEVVQSARKALLVRYSLLPYLYTLLWKSHVNGNTVARPLFFEFPLDTQTYSIDEQFLWGSALMIIPVLVENKTEVVAYLPQAMWYNFYTWDLINSTGAKYTFPAPLDTIPLSVRGGNIIPMQTPSLTTAETRKNDIELLVASDERGEATGSLYWDDGDSLNTWKDGHYNLLNFSMKDSILSSVVSRWGYDEPLILGKVILLGVDTPVKDVYVNEATRPFIYHTSNRVLEMKNLNIPLKKIFTLHWS